MDLESFLQEVCRMFTANQIIFNGYMLNYCIELYENGITDVNDVYDTVKLHVCNEDNQVLANSNTWLLSDPSNTIKLENKDKTIRKSHEHEQYVVIPHGCTKLNDYEFENSEVTEIELPNRLFEIGKCCFLNSKITRITIPDSVTVLKRSAFENCNQLTEVNLSTRLKEIKIKTFAFSQIKSIIIPEGVTRLKSYCFYGCNQLQHVKLPNSLEE